MTAHVSPLQVSVTDPEALGAPASGADGASSHPGGRRLRGRTLCHTGAREPLWWAARLVSWTVAGTWGRKVVCSHPQSQLRAVSPGTHSTAVRGASSTGCLHPADL